MTLTGEEQVPSSAALHDDTPRTFGPLDWALAAVLWGVVFAAFIRAGGYGFIFFDDQAYVASNPYVQAGLSWGGVKYAFTHLLVNNWHPLTILTSEVLSSLFGPSAGTFHAANVVLHAAAVAMLFGVLRVATGRRWPAVAAAVLWGLHPLRVESVAWVAELKDELSSLTWLGCGLAYVAYAGRRTPRRYLAVVGLYVLAVLAKPSAVTLPFALLLTDYWPLGRNTATDPPAGRFWRGRVAEKLPLFAIAAGAAVVAIYGQSSPHVLVKIPLSARLSNAVVSVAAYLRQTVWPTGLSLFYPHPWQVHRPPSALLLVGSVALILALTGLALAGARRRPYLIVGWLWFLGVLVPNVGLLQAGEQARADRFTLLPAMGLTVAVVWLVADWAAARPSRRAVAGVAAGLAAVGLTVATEWLLPTWYDSRSVWEHADRAVPYNYLARATRSVQQTYAGDLPGGERLAREAIAMATEASDGHAALAMNLSMQADQPGHHDRAAVVREFNTALSTDRTNPLLRYEAGMAMVRAGQDPAARKQFERALQLDPTLVDAQLALAGVMGRAGDYPGAIAVLRQSLAMAPDDAQAEGDLADALRRNHQADEAVPLFFAALAHGSHNAEWESELAWLVGQDAGSTPDQLTQAVGPAKDAADQSAATKDPFPPYAYSLVLARLGRFDDAIAAAEQARAFARAAGRAEMAAAIANRLTAYRMGLPATRPTTAPAATGPVMRP